MVARKPSILLTRRKRKNSTTDKITALATKK